MIVVVAMLSYINGISGYATNIGEKRADKKVRHSLANDLEKFSNNEENEDG